MQEFYSCHKLSPLVKFLDVASQSVTPSHGCRGLCGRFLGSSRHVLHRPDPAAPGRSADDAHGSRSPVRNPVGGCKYFPDCSKLALPEPSLQAPWQFVRFSLRMKTACCTAIFIELIMLRTRRRTLELVAEGHMTQQTCN